jgi:hypothetical protein
MADAFRAGPVIDDEYPERSNETLLRLTRYAYLAKSFRTRNGRWPASFDEMAVPAQELARRMTDRYVDSTKLPMAEMVKRRGPLHLPLVMKSLAMTKELLGAVAFEVRDYATGSKVSRIGNSWVGESHPRVESIGVLDMLLCERSVRLRPDDRNLTVSITVAEDVTGPRDNEKKYTGHRKLVSSEIDDLIRAAMMRIFETEDLAETLRGSMLDKEFSRCESDLRKLLNPTEKRGYILRFELPHQEEVFTMWSAGPNGNYLERPDFEHGYGFVCPRP